MKVEAFEAESDAKIAEKEVVMKKRFGCVSCGSNVPKKLESCYSCAVSLCVDCFAQKEKIRLIMEVPIDTSTVRSLCGQPAMKNRLFDGLKSERIIKDVCTHHHERNWSRKNGRNVKQRLAGKMDCQFTACVWWCGLCVSYVVVFYCRKKSLYFWNGHRARCTP